MTRKEFYDRTGVEVSLTEFDALHIVYMKSDLDKDEFCKLWKRMNATRVEAAKAERKRQADENTKRIWLCRLRDKYDDFDNTIKLYWDVLSQKEQDRLVAYGFSMTKIKYFQLTNEYLEVLKQWVDIAYDITKYLTAEA